MLPTPADIQQARARIAGIARHTPLERSAWLSEHCGQPVHLKLECWQRTHSFKLRGALNAIALLSDAQRARGLVTASAGNHGQAVALAAREVGARAMIFLPATTPAGKIARVRGYGADLDLQAPHYDGAHEAAVAYAERTGATFVHAFSDPAVVAGQGTVGLEILEDRPQVRTVIAPVGGGGLIGGVGIALKAADPSIRIIGVQSTATTAMYDAFQAGRIVDSPIPPTLAEGLAGMTDEAAYHRARSVVDELVLVDEATIAGAIGDLYRHDGIVAEGSAAVVVAALLHGAVAPAGETVLIISGGNIDAARLASILSDT